MKIWIYYITPSTLIDSLENIWSTGSFLGLDIPEGSQMRSKKNQTINGTVRNVLGIAVPSAHAGPFDASIPGGEHYDMISSYSVPSGENPWQANIEDSQAAIAILAADVPNIAP